MNALVAEYQEASASSLARKYGTSVWTIINRLETAGVRIRSNKEQNEKRLNLSEAQNELFLEVVDGILLSDGSIDPKGCLRLEQSHAHAGWLEHIVTQWNSIGGSARSVPISPRERTIDGRKVFSGGGFLLYTPCYVELQEQRARWYPRGIKRVPSDVVLSPLSLAYWICGDGTYDKQGALFFCTNGFLKKEIHRLAQLLTDFGVRARCVPVPSRRRQWKIAITQRDASEQLRTRTEAHMPECFLYKFAHVRAAIPRGTAQTKLTPEQVTQIRERCGTRQGLLAREFGVSQTTISRILCGEAHRGKSA